MILSKLRSLYKACKQNPNYHFRDLTDEAFLDKAKKSFARLQPKQQQNVLTSWTAAIANDSEPKSPNEIVEEMVTMRFLAQTNLFFLGNVLEKYSQMTLNTHEDICNGFFTQKDPTFGTFEEFANQYTDLKDKMLLVPRGGFKSSIDIADCVQWVICFPENTILILTGVYKLAGDFLKELRYHFTLEENGVLDTKTAKSGFGPRILKDKETQEWSPSMFQILFPEHCIKPSEGTQFEFLSPAAGDEKEPSVRAASIEQALSGMHFGVIKLDDVVTNENSLNIDRINGVNAQISVNRAMLHPYGFMDVIGTWYDEYDYYGMSIKQEETFAEEMGLLENIKGSVDSGKFNSSVYVKVYLRAAWWPTAEAKAKGMVEAEMKKEHYELWFPERLHYEFLAKEKKKDFAGFAIKYLNNPRQIHKVKFPRELLLRRTIPFSQMPPQGIIVTTVDTAYSTKSWADYTVIMTALISGGRFYIVNMVRGRFNEFELPAVIAGVGHKWKPKRIAIEDSVGVKWMARELRREMDKLQISIPIEYVSLGLGTKAKSKQLKAKPVVRLLGDERMYFSNACEGLNEIYSELEKFTGTSDDANDDIVSALSLLADVFGAYADQDNRMQLTQMDFVADLKSKEYHDLVHGLGKYARFNAAALSQDDHPNTVFKMENSNVAVSTSEADPLSDLF